MVASLTLMGGGKKAKGYLLTVHIESSEEEAPKFAAPAKLGSEGRQYYFKIIPEITDDHVAWFYPSSPRTAKLSARPSNSSRTRSQATERADAPTPGKVARNPHSQRTS